MNTTFQTFTNESLGTIHCLTIDGAPYFVGKDIATTLGYSNPRDAIRKHIEDDDKKRVANRDGKRGNPYITVINESGLYSLILSSKLPSAKEFKRWVTSEILPTLRRCGVYALAGEKELAKVDPEASSDLITPMRSVTPDDYLAAAKLIARCKDDRLNAIICLLSHAGLEVSETRQALASVTTNRAWDVGTRLKRTRALTNLTWKQLGQMTGCSAAQLQGYASGYRAPRECTLERITRALDNIDAEYCNAIADEPQIIDVDVNEDAEPEDEFY